MKTYWNGQELDTSKEYKIDTIASTKGKGNSWYVTKTVVTISAILNLLLAVLAFICVVIGAINKSCDLLVASAVTVVTSIFPATLMLSLCNEFKDVK